MVTLKFFMFMIRRLSLSNLFCHWNHFSKEVPHTRKNTTENNWIYTISYRSSRSQMFFKIGVLKFRYYRRKTPVVESVFNIKKRVQHRCFSVKLTKFLRTPIFTEILRWLLLSYENAHLSYRSLKSFSRNISNGCFRFFNSNTYWPMPLL